MGTSPGRKNYVNTMENNDSQQRFMPEMIKPMYVKLGWKSVPQEDVALR
jgi:hypothetical protein